MITVLTTRVETHSNKATSKNSKSGICFYPQIWWLQSRVRVRGVRPCNSAVSLEHVFLMILLWKTKQNSGTEEGDVSRLMTCFMGVKNVFFSAWDCLASWLDSEWLTFERMSILSCRLWLHLVLIVGFFRFFATYFPSGQWNTSCHPLPVPFMPSSLFIFPAWIVKILIFSAGNLTGGSGKLQVYKHELSQEFVLSDVVYCEEHLRKQDRSYMTQFPKRLVLCHDKSVKISVSK